MQHWFTGLKSLAADQRTYLGLGALTGRCLLAAALDMPSPRAPLRPLTLYTMLILGYCAGLRVGEFTRLALADFRPDDGTIEIRNTKFFKSRRLPLTASVVADLERYVAARPQAGASQEPAAALFWNEQGGRGYTVVTAQHLLTEVIRRAGLKPAAGRVGPRVHDLRHALVVDRMLSWYREGCRRAVLSSLPGDVLRPQRYLFYFGLSDHHPGTSAAGQRAFSCSGC